MRTLLLLLVVACSPKVPVTEVRSARYDWCFELDVDGETAQGCTESRKLCEKALKTTRKYGSVAGVDGVTDCEAVD